MFFIVQVPATENPASPGFYELLGFASSGQHFWTTRPGDAKRFGDRANADRFFFSLPSHITASAFVKELAWQDTSRPQREPPSPPSEAEIQAKRDDDYARRYRDRRGS